MAYNAESAIRRADQVLCEFISEKHTLEHGIAFFSQDFSQSGEHNSFREVLIESAVELPDIWQALEAVFEQRGLTCGSWVPCAEQRLEVLDAYLTHVDFSKMHYAAMQMSSWPDLDVNPAVRILPARAMRKTLRALQEQQGHPAPQLTEVQMDYPQYDLFVATLDGQPAGYAGLMQAGEVGMLRDVYVADVARRTKVGSTLVAHLLEMSRRLMMKIVVAKVAVDNAPAIRFSTHCGFEEQGQLVEYHRR